VQQAERPTGSVDLKVQIKAVDGREMPDGCMLPFISGIRHPPPSV
jgi:hypothetical protein